jgi:hypothetical protein
LLVHFENFNEGVVESESLGSVEEFLGVQESLATFVSLVESLFSLGVLFWGQSCHFYLNLYLLN